MPISERKKKVNLSFLQERKDRLLGRNLSLKFNWLTQVLKQEKKEKLQTKRPTSTMEKKVRLLVKKELCMYRWLMQRQNLEKRVINLKRLTSLNQKNPLVRNNMKHFISLKQVLAKKERLLNMEKLRKGQMES